MPHNTTRTQLLAGGQAFCSEYRWLDGYRLDQKLKSAFDICPHQNGLDLFACRLQADIANLGNLAVNIALANDNNQAISNS